MEFFVDFVAAHKAEVIAADVIKNQVIQERFGLFLYHKVLPSHLFIDFGLGFGGGADGILAVFQRGQNTGVFLTGFAGNYFNGFYVLFN